LLIKCSSPTAVQSGAANALLYTNTLFHWTIPASPHLAAQHDRNVVPDDEVLASIRTELVEVERRAGGQTPFTLLETAVCIVPKCFLFFSEVKA
jgi:hypothetical protein